MTAPPDVLTSAAELAPLLADRGDEIEQGRRLPDEVVEALDRARVFDMFARPAIGGPGIDPVTAYETLEILARANPSAAWCAMVSTSSSYLTGWLGADAAAELFGSPARMRLSGSSRPLGRAEPTSGGFRVSGRWDFASGIGHASVLIASCQVDGGGATVAFVQPSDAEVVDTWTTMGMRGTGSNDMVLDGVFVPEAHTAWFENDPAQDLPLYHRRLLRVVTHSPAVAVALGAARGALDDFAELASEAASTSSPVRLRDRAETQVAMARAESIVVSAQQQVHDSIAEAWSIVENDTGDPGPAIARTRMAMAVAGDAALDAASMLLRVSGTSGVFARHRLERRVRDLYVISQFSAFKTDNLVGAGQVLLGLEPDGPGW